MAVNRGIGCGAGGKARLKVAGLVVALVVPLALAAVPAARAGDGPRTDAIVEPGAKPSASTTLAEPAGDGPYRIAPPVAGGPQIRYVEAEDGTPLHTQTWLPDEKDGNVPPDRVPVVLVYTPYGSPGAPEVPALIDLLVPRGFAVTFANVRGSGGSGGCFTFGGSEEIGDGARVVEDAGELAPWASGTVGMFGASYPGATQISVSTGEDRDRLESLKALLIGAPAASFYDFVHHDGVPHFLQGTGSTLVYYLTLTSPQSDLSHIADRPGCALDVMAGASNMSGDFTPYWDDRDYADNLDRLEAATFMYHGTADRRVPHLMQAGLFDAIPADVPRFGLFGMWGHEYPTRDDFADLVVAWYDRHLRGIDNGVDDWPVAQVEDTAGGWQNVPEWPAVPGRTEKLLIGGGGKLGATAPSGSTTYLETPVPELEVPQLGGLLSGGQPLVSATFETAPMATKTRITGTIWMDLWVELAVPDGHISARLEVVDADGARIVPASRTMGARSARHLEPLVNDRFRQSRQVAPPVGQPVLVPVRFDPIAMVVPQGARLRLTVAGTSIAFDGLDGVAPGLGAIFQGPAWPSGLIAPVKILHNAKHPSAIRYTVS